MPHVVIAANRLPVTVKKKNGRLVFERSAGGVSTGLSSLIKNGQNKWVGWPGIASDDLTRAEQIRVYKELGKRNCVPVFLSQQQIDDFYGGFSNTVLWPLLHTLPLSDDKPKDHKRWWKAYREVNDLYAETVLKFTRPDTTVWVHDYQLILVSSALRKQLPNNHIGFFLHVPFPERKVLAKIPESKRLVGDLLAADLIGFHTPGYVANFIDAVHKYGFGEAHGDQLILGERTIRITEFPIGIDFEQFTGAQKLPAVKKAASAFAKKYRGLKVVAGVDRLDITKGFIERLNAYRLFLERNPKQRGKVVFALVGAPSRGDVAAYQRLGKRVDKLVADINAEFGTKRWQPVDYINETLPFEQVVGLFQVANVGFVAPVRDGMNLVAKEYIASRRKNGVLILSRGAGAAEELTDALIVDLKQPETMVSALEQALTMRRSEAQKRFKRLEQRVANQTIHKWSKDFMKTLQKPVILSTTQLRAAAKRQIIEQYSNTHKRAFVLDYDGCLTELVDRTQDAAPKKELLTTLTRLGKDKANVVYVISGRSRDDLEGWLGKTGIGLIAEHGAFIRKPGTKRWQRIATADTNWKQDVLPVLGKYAALTPGTYIEEKSTALVWHYREASPYKANKNRVLLKKELKTTLDALGLKAYDGKMIVEIKHKDTHKGVAVKELLNAHDFDFILNVGDDYTDESMFRVVPEWAYSLKVGAGNSRARYRVKDPNAVRILLAQLR